MVRTLKFLLQSQLKRSRMVQQVGGFTMIELLIAMILAFLIITPMLGFMVNIMDTDRKEQAKANSEQEIQTALDYIARDLQQAIYIYDADGVTRNSNSDATLSGIKDQIPPGCDTTATNTSCQPILVFWKRELVSKVIPITGGNNDTFVYSLVAYYLLKDTNTTWSKAARITRWQIRDGVPATTGGVTCTGYTDNYISTDLCPNPGFTLFKLDGVGTLKQKMNTWKKTATNYSTAPIVLVDFIDQSTTGTLTCPTGTSLISHTITSFSACVDIVNTTAQIFLRGNALARLQSNNLNDTDTNKTYFPRASIRVQGRGYLFTK